MTGLEQETSVVGLRNSPKVSGRQTLKYSLAFEADR